jgi:predicted nucleic acid-binding protein
LILVDTSIWIDHLRSADAKLQTLLQNDQVVTHPCIRLELALGSISSREKVLANLALLPQAPVVASGELFTLIEHEMLHRRGIGLTDLQLLCCALFDTSIQSGPETSDLARLQMSSGRARHCINFSGKRW